MNELERARNEIAEIDALLANLDKQRVPLEKRKNDLRAWIELGQRLFGSGLPHPSADFKESLQRSALRQVARPASMKAQILQISEKVISEGGPLPTRDLIPLIEAEGVQITGADKMVTVSVILSRSDRFMSDRTLGWSLVRPHKEETPSDAATSTGS